MNAKERAEAILALVAEAVATGTAIPTNVELMAQFEWGRTMLALTLGKLTKAGRLYIQTGGGRRRVSLDGEAWSAWSGGGTQVPGERRRRPPKEKRVPKEKRQQTIQQATRLLHKQVLGLLTCAASECRPLPTVRAMASAIGSTEGKVDSALRGLRMAHTIRIETVGMRRRAIITATGRATAWSSPGNKTPQGIDNSLRNPSWAIPTGPRGGGPWPEWLTCQYLHGEGKARNFCGEPTVPGSSYCEHHHALCHVPAPAMEIAA